MSIVLVIIGLVVGGVLAGQDLIRAAEIQKFGTTISQLDTAVNTFYGKYNCLPGDCANASNFFGQNGSCSFSGNIPVTTTCNGNGDGDIYSVDGSGSSVSNGGQENGYFFQQLILAGLIADTRYCTSQNSTCGTSRYMSYWGLNTPFPSTNAYGPAALGIVSLLHSTWEGPATGMEGVHHAYFILDHSDGECASYPPSILASIDSKFDDGYPLSGSIETIGFNGGSVGAGIKYSFNGYFDCAASNGWGTCYNATATPQTYTAGNTNLACPVMWRAGF
jgi:hypothetical protein